MSDANASLDAVGGSMEFAHFGFARNDTTFAIIRDSCFNGEFPFYFGF